PQADPHRCPRYPPATDGTRAAHGTEIIVRHSSARYAPTWQRPSLGVPAMTARPVHWHEGMFLRPHHFQAAQRYAAAELARGTHWTLHHDWGLRTIDLDRDALANNRFVVRSLRARFRDGTLVSLPEDGDLPALDLKPVLEKNPSVTVLIGLPTLHLGRANVSTARSDTARFTLDSQ